MAVKPFSKEQLNFFKFSTLVLDEFPKVLREVFVMMWDSKVAVRPGFIVWDDSPTVRNMLRTSEGGKTKIPTMDSIEKWDCTALFKATIYAKTFSKGVSTLDDLYLKTPKLVPGSFHPSVQSPTGNQDETYALAIDQLRLLRNTLCHSPKPEIVKSDFDNYVQLVKSALLAVNVVDTTFVDVVGGMSEDDFPTEKVQQLSECLVRELQAISMFHENMEQKLSSIDERTEKMEKMMDNISVGDKSNAPDSLPKPHIPSTVPMFTGREDEIEEITNLITNQSTRLLNIWGSPGFGKTATAIAVAHHLSYLEYPVYFFKLQGIISESEFLSQILSIFKSNVVDLSLTPLDRLVSIWREISCPIYLVFDNLDDFLSRVTDAEAKLFRTFDKFLDSSTSINILFTTRELLESIRDEVAGFQHVRIRPLSPVSSVEFVRKLISSFPESIIAQVAAICSYVPLAMKLVAPLVKKNSQEMAKEILAELEFPENLKQFANMQDFFNVPFERLTLNDKRTLISLTVFSSATVSKDAAMEVVSGETGSKSIAAGSLKTLVAKSLIDEDFNGKCYSIHPLIYSFVVDKARRNDFAHVVYSSRIRFCGYYLCLFEKINGDFLAGKSVDSPQLQEALYYLSTAMFQSIASDDENSQDVFRILSKSEIFLFFIGIGFRSSLDIHKLYDLAIEKCKTRNDVAYLELYVSKYFHCVTDFSLFVSSANSEIPEDIRKEIMSSEGTAAKLCCYEGIVQIREGNIKSGIQVIEKHFEGLQKCADQQLLKCLCLQLLALFYNDSKQRNKSTVFSKKAVEIGEEIGNYHLFLIDYHEHVVSMKPEMDKGEPLILFVYLLYMWSSAFVGAETKHYFLNFVNELQQKKEHEEFVSVYLNQILRYADFLLAVLGVSSGQEAPLNKKIDFLHETLRCEDNTSSTGGIFPIMGNKSDSLAYTSERLLSCYIWKSTLYRQVGKQDLSIEECLNAHKICLQQHGKVHEKTAYWYVQIGLARYNAESYTSALRSFDEAHEIMKVINDGSSSSQDIVADIYTGKGETYMAMSKWQSAVTSFEEAIRVKTKLLDSETTEMARIVHLLGASQYACDDLPAALATLKQAHETFKKLYAEKGGSVLGICVARGYDLMGKVHINLGNKAESKKCFEAALEISQEWPDCERALTVALQVSICMGLLDLGVDENQHTKLFDRSLPILEDRFEFLLPIMYMTLAAKELNLGKHQAGLASVQKALDISLDVTLQASADCRSKTVSCYLILLQQLFMATLLNEKVRLGRKILDRAIKIAESLPEAPEGKKHIQMLCCYSFKGYLHYVNREYVSEIESLEHALHLFEVSSCKGRNKLGEYACRKVIATAHFNQGAYKDSLTSLYMALSILTDVLPAGSELEAQVYILIAKIAEKMNNKNLFVNNLRLAYKMYSKVLGKNHPATEQSYVAYVRALIS